MDNSQSYTSGSGSTSFSTSGSSIKQGMGGGYPIPDASGPRTNKNPAKQAEFQQLFNLPNEEVVEDYTCAYQGDAILYHGRMYMTYNSICFHSQIFKKTLKVIPFEDIVDISKKNTAIVFPNAIEFSTSKRKFTFASFMYRDHAYKLAIDLWQEVRRGEREKPSGELIERLNSTYGSPSDSSLLDTENPADTDADALQPHAGDYSGEGIVTDGAGVLADASNAVTGAADFLWRHTTPVLQSAVSLFADGEATSEGGHPPDDSQQDQTKMRASENRPAPKSPLPQADSDALVPASTSAIVVKESKGKEINDKPQSQSPPQHAPQSHPQPQPQSQPVQTQPQSQQPQQSAQPPLQSTQSQQTMLEPKPEQKFGSKRLPGGPSVPEPGAPIKTTQPALATSAAPPHSSPPSSGSQVLSQSSPAPGVAAPTSTAGAAPTKVEPARKKTIQAPLAPLGHNCPHIGEMKKDAVVLDMKIDMTILAFYYNFIAEERSDAFWHSLNQELGYPDSKIGAWKVCPERCCSVRPVSFVVPLTHPLGPKSTRAAQTQRVRFKTKEHMVMSTSTVSVDVPFTDTFTTEALWEVTTVSASPTNPIIRLQVSAWVQFSKSPWLKGVIQKNAEEGINTFYPVFERHLLAAVQGIKRKQAAARAQRAAAGPDASNAAVSAVSAPAGITTASATTSTSQAVPKLKGEDSEDEGEPEFGAPSSLTSVDPVPADTSDTFTSSHTTLRPYGQRTTEASSEGVMSRIMGLVMAIPRKDIIIPLVLCLFLLFPVYGLFGRMSYVESELTSLRGRNTELEQRVAFLQTLVGVLSQNVTGTTDADIWHQWAYWRVTGKLDEQLARWKDSFRDLDSSLSRAQHLLRHFLYSLSPPPGTAGQDGASKEPLLPVFLDEPALQTLQQDLVAN